MPDQTCGDERQHDASEHDDDPELQREARQVGEDQQSARKAHAAAMLDGDATEDEALPAARPASPTPTPCSRSGSPGPRRRKEGLPCRELVQRTADVYVVGTQDELSQHIKKVLRLRPAEALKCISGDMRADAVILKKDMCVRI